MFVRHETVIRNMEIFGFVRLLFTDFTLLEICNKFSFGTAFRLRHDICTVTVPTHTHSTLRYINFHENDFSFYRLLCENKNFISRRWLLLHLWGANEFAFTLCSLELHANIQRLSFRLRYTVDRRKHSGDPYEYSKKFHIVELHYNVVFFQNFPFKVISKLPPIKLRQYVANHFPLYSNFLRVIFVESRHFY